MFGSPDEEYGVLMGLLHQFAHVNPNMVGHGRDNNLAHASHAFAYATIYLLRSIGYRLMLVTVTVPFTSLVVPYAVPDAA